MASETNPESDEFEEVNTSPENVTIRQRSEFTDKSFYLSKAKEFVELHDQVESSVKLLDSLEVFLSGFQKDLSAVSGQISDLQDRSKDIDNKLKSRRKIEKPLSGLVSELTIPPDLAILILDSEVGEPWIEEIANFERRLDISKSRTRVKAARDLGEVSEGLRIVAATKIRAFFLVLFNPIKSSVTTNMQVIQTSVLLKYQSLYGFLQRKAPNVAQEVQRSYIVAARVYYETGFRRYTRSLGWLKAKSTERFESIAASQSDADLTIDQKRLAYSKIDGPAVTLAYMAEDKSHKEPVEALLRSALLVLMDNATAEYAFITSFFASQSIPSPAPLSALVSPDTSATLEQNSNIYSEMEALSNRRESTPSLRQGIQTKDEQSTFDAVWKQVLDPVLEYCQKFIRSAYDPVPPVTSLLTMIRLTEDVMLEVQKRSCPPLENFIFGIRIQMWPVFKDAMNEHVQSVKKLAEGSGGGFFARAAASNDAQVSTICRRYVVLFKSFVSLTGQQEETMIFSNLLRLRQELLKLILKHTEQSASSDVAKATKQSSLFEELLQGLRKGDQLAPHVKSQQEIAFWAEKEEEARRSITSVGRNNRK